MFKNILLVVSASTLSVSVPALAQVAPTTADSCGGNACVTQWTVGGTALFGAAGASMFEGETGYNLIEKAGSGGVDIEVNADGGLCGVDCSDGGFTFSGFARETISVSTGAWGEQSGTLVQAQNQALVTGAVNFSLSKNMTAPSTGE